MTQTLPNPTASRPVARLIRVRWQWITGITLLVLLGTGLLTLLTTPTYQATAQVLVLSEVKPNLTPQAPSMGTEKDLMLSDVVTSVVSERTGIPQSELIRSATVSVPPDTQTLEVTCSSPDPATAARCSQEIAESYVAYKDSQPINSLPERARVVTAAAVPAQSSSPAVALNLVAALIVGLVLGVLAAMLRDRLDDRVRGAGDLEHRGLRVLGELPPGGNAVTAPGADTFRSLGARVRVALARSDAGRPGGGSPGDASAPPDAPVLMVSPLHTGGGSVARELATALATGGDRVVFVDADSSDTHPGLAPGLLDALAGRVEPSAVMSGTPGSQLRCMSMGRRPAGSAIGISPRRWAETAAALAGACDVVVVAAPQLDSADGINLAQHASAVLFVARDGHSARSAVDRAVAEAGELDVPVLGCVLEAGGPDPSPGGVGPAPDAGPPSSTPRPAGGPGQPERPLSATNGMPPRAIADARE